MSKKKRDSSEGSFPEGATTESRPQSPSSSTDSSKETFQEGTTPVQAFSTPVVPAVPAIRGRVRQGRPPRVAPAKPTE
jgi:hypothetical protein